MKSLELRWEAETVDVACTNRFLDMLREIDWRGVTEVRFDLGRIRTAGTVLLALVAHLRRVTAAHSVRLSVGPISPAVAALLSLHRLTPASLSNVPDRDASSNTPCVAQY